MVTVDYLLCSASYLLKATFGESSRHHPSWWPGIYPGFLGYLNRPPKQSPKHNSIYQAACLPVLFLAVRMWVLWYWTQPMFRLWRQRSVSRRNSQIFRTHSIVPENTRSLSLMDINAFFVHWTTLSSHWPQNHSFTIKCTLAHFTRVGEECSAVHPQGSSAFFFLNFSVKSVTLTLFPLLDGVRADWMEWQWLAAKRGQRRIKADTLSSTIWTDSSYGLLGFIIPLLRLTPYHRGQAVLHL